MLEQPFYHIINGKNCVFLKIVGYSNKKAYSALCVPIFIQSTSRREEIFFPGYLLPIEDDNILAGVF